MITLTSVIFPVITIACGLWIFRAMIAYIAEIQRDIKDSRRRKTQG